MITRFKWLYKGQKFQYKNTIWEKTDKGKALCSHKSLDFQAGAEITLPPNTYVSFDPKSKKEK